jgi:2-methylcitrate dehydratase PrpD
MFDPRRRSFFHQSMFQAGLGLTSLQFFPIHSIAQEITKELPGKDATKILANYANQLRFEDLPSNIVKETTRAFVNYMGVTIGSCRHEAVDIAVATLAPLSASKQATILGRKERFDVFNAAFINGIGSHVFDFDDTHLLTNVHPAGPIACALLAFSEIQPITGKEFLSSLYLGIELSIRLSNFIAPSHAGVGWHVSGTSPTIGAAAAIGRLLKLSEEQMMWALSLAASQPTGFRESFGSMTKSFNPGRAASNGLLSALLAKKNFTSSQQMIESRIGWAKSVSQAQNYDELLGDLGVRFETAKDTYKPFPCGIVIHPALDAAITLKNKYAIEPGQIQSITFKGNPQVLELTGKKTPKTGLEGKFSVYHSIAVALITGKASEKQYSDQAVNDPKTISLREKINVIVDEKIPKKSGELTITMSNGQVYQQFIDSAIGGVENPMTDAQLNAKFLDLTEGVLPLTKNKRILERSWQITKETNLGNLTKFTTPS